VRANLGLPADQYEYEPCVVNYAEAYLNRADVKAALHANAAITWAECSTKTPYGTLAYNYSWSDVPMCVGRSAFSTEASPCSFPLRCLRDHNSSSHSTDETDTFFLNREPYYQYLIDNAKLKILVFSGDDDSICGTIGTQSWYVI
jgi:hypothetical protein